MAFHISFLILKPLLLLLALNVVPFTYTNGCVDEERLALLDFKKSFASFPQNSGKLSSWNSSEVARNCCTWEGITCDYDTRHVVSLSLFGQQLESYQLRPSLLQLQHLSSLNLGFNNFAMRIPKFIGSLGELTSLDLSDSGFFGTIPPQLGNLSKLQTLDLSGNKLVVPFSDIFHDMISLISLDLSGGNYIEDGGFNSIGNLCNLSKLYASGSTTNQTFPNIIKALSGCASSSLEDLWLNSMNLKGTIPPMLKFTSLSILELSNNRLEFPPQKGELLNLPQASIISSPNLRNGSLLNNTLPLFPSSLRALYLENNNLNGVLTDVHFANLSNLQRLSLASNPDLRVTFNKTLLRGNHLDLSCCNLGPSFPSWIPFEQLEYLDISQNNISSTIPIMFWMSFPSSLTYLNLSSNSLYGTLPNIPLFIYSDFGSVIDLSSNVLSGPVPYFLFNVEMLYLSNNNFSGFGPILYPSSNSTTPLYNNHSHRDDQNLINFVDLSNNRLSGSIPYWLGFMTPQLVALFLTNNNLSGTIPNSLGHATQLKVLSLRNNSFSGPLPYSLLQNCSQLGILDLAGNRFSETIPPWIGDNLKNLIVLSLSSNNLTGILPVSLCQVRSLQILDLSHNFLSGIIPSCIQNFTAMAHPVTSNLTVSYRVRIIGVINGVPLEKVAYFNAFITWKSHVWQFQSTLYLVKLIDLSSNNFSGEIPTGLVSLLELDSLDLSSNNLQGSIPEQIGQLKSLEYLNLSHNRLHGQIPPSLSEISFLEMLDLSHNNLSGRIPEGRGQLQSFHPSDFAGNPYLCGLPLCKCPGDNDDLVQALQPSRTDESHEMEDKWLANESFYGGMGAGFAFGFLGILGSLTWITKWRYAFFQLATRFGEWILLVAALRISKIARKIQFK